MQLSWQFVRKPFQAPKILFKSVKLIGQKSLSYGHLLKDKRLKFTFLRGPTVRFWYKEVHHQRTLKSMQTGISQVYLNLRLWPDQKSKVWFFFYGKRFIWENFVVWKLGDFGLKTSTSPRLHVVAIRVAYLVAFTTIA